MISLFVASEEMRQRNEIEKGPESNWEKES